MVGLVLVSHSRPLAEAVKDLLQQLTTAELTVSVAAGIGPDRREFGTDPLEIASAIQSVFSEDGVVVLMDLGSAVLSAEMAVELLPEEQRSRIRCCPAALVEGAIAAAALAGAGAGLDQVCAEARNALKPKIQHLEGGQTGIETGAPGPADLPALDIHTATLAIRNEHGLHARPAARFVKAAGAYQADIQVTNLRNGKGPVSARSLNALATLGALAGDRILVAASGPQASQALAALQQLVDGRFDLPAVPFQDTVSNLPEESVPRRTVTGGGSLKGVPLAEGIAIGPLVFYRPEMPRFDEAHTGDPDQEWKRFQEAVRRTRTLIERQRLETLSRAGELQAEIFTAHQLILEDPGLQNEVKERILQRGQPAGLAWQESIARAVEDYLSLNDPYLQARSADVNDVGRQLLLILQEDPGEFPVQMAGPGILYLDTITPAQVVRLDQAKVLGLVIYGSGPTSHSAILARALGFPAVGGVDLEEMGVQPGTRVAIDGATGEIWCDPIPDIQAELDGRRKAWLEHRQLLFDAGQAPAVTRDGRKIEVAANVGSLAEARAVVQSGAEGIGVLRTEFLYLSRDGPPGEEEQLAALVQIAQALGGQKVIVRTLDIGGDKFLPYLPLPREANPYLGVRGLRLSMRMSDLFQTQLRSILRAGAEFPLSVMFPMVSSLEEVAWAQEQLVSVHQSLDREALAHGWPVDTGIMVEVPSAALIARSLAPLVDFFSIGTNDLAQYTLAAERGNPELAGLGDAMHPAVLGLIREVVDAAHAYGRWVGVCGEIAADPLAAPVLVGLGVDELSMNLAGIPQIKSLIRRLDLPTTQRIAAQALACSGAQAVRALVQSEYRGPAG